MNVKQIKDWVSLYPDDFEIRIITQYGSCDISPIGQTDGKNVALVILPKETIEKMERAKRLEGALA